ncbi:MAG: zinc ribbon domain-containing protein [Acidimicrobiales bacterium]
MTVFDALLEVQEHDTTIDQLRHRRAHLPERAELVTVTAGGDRLRAQRTELGARRDEVLGRQSRLEASLTAADDRITEIDGRLYSGQVTATRDILAMTAEIESLKSRRSSLEDQVLVAMEEDEPLAAEVADLESQVAAAEQEAERLRATIAAAEAEIDAELATMAEERAGCAAQVPADLLATYERLRARLGGIGAARLVGANCAGCHLTLPAQELARIKREPPDALVFCDQCGRILVR